MMYLFILKVFIIFFNILYVIINMYYFSKMLFLKKRLFIKIINCWILDGIKIWIFLGRIDL